MSHAPKPCSAAEVEDNTLMAMEDMAKNPTLTVRKAAAKWGIGRERLRGRLQGRLPKTSFQPPNRKLDKELELSLLLYCKHLDEIGVAARPSLVQQSAQQLLARIHKGHGSPPMLGKNWVGRFIKRHPELKLVKQKTLDIKRIITHDPEAIRRYFVRLRRVIRTNGIQPKDMWNYDEVGFRVGIGGPHWIVTMEPDKHRFIASDTNRDSVTCCEAVNAAGDTIPPMIILPAANIYASFVENDLPGGTLLACSSEGYIDDVLGLRWLEHFALFSRKGQVGKYRLLILDGHSSHLTYDFLRYADENNIIVFQLPPHSTHLLQPLDLVVFQPYKHWHREAVDAATRTGCTDFNKYEFLAALNGIRAQTFKPRTILAAWRSAGIHPFDPEVVLSSLRTEYGVEEEEDTSPPSQPPSTPVASSPPATPKTVRSLHRSADRLQRTADGPLSPTLERFIRGSLAQAHLAHSVHADLLNQTAERQARTQRKQMARRILSSGGVLYAAEARDIEATRKETEKMEETAKALKRKRIEANKAAAEARVAREQALAARREEREIESMTRRK